MPIQPYFDQKEPPQDAEIWRFMDLFKFQDLMGTQELHFCRADLFTQDHEEGIPPEEYLRLVKRYERYVIEDEKNLNHDIGSLSQMREMYYISCWHLFRKETPAMWKDFGKDGVAICSRYELLKSVLDGMLDEAHVGLVQYGDAHLAQTMRMNVLQFITTKRANFSGEVEVRAFINSGDPLAGHNLHFDENDWPHREPLQENERYRHHWVHKFKRRRINLQKLMAGVVLSPWATQEVFDEVKLWLQVRQLSCPVSHSELRGQ